MRAWVRCKMKLLTQYSIGKGWGARDHDHMLNVCGNFTR